MGGGPNRVPRQRVIVIVVVVVVVVVLVLVLVVVLVLVLVLVVVVVVVGLERTNQDGKGNPRSPTYLEETPGRTPHR